MVARMEWHDGDWMSGRAARNGLDAPMSIYELHIGSWRRKNGSLPNYRDLAPELADYIDSLGFTHVELMRDHRASLLRLVGIPDHRLFLPDRALWDAAGFHVPRRSPASAGDRRDTRLGTLALPDRRARIDLFDGTHLYEHADARQGFHPEWHSAIFNYGRNEVRSFLVSSALFWLNALSHRRTARRRRRLHAVSGLRARGTANGFRTASAGARTSRPRSFCAP